jgi:hypothetical protein
MAKQTPRQLLIRELRLLLGGGVIENELTPEHFDLAFDIALDRYRQRSDNSTEERIAFLNLQANQNSYTLPDEIIHVKQVFRSGAMGTVSGTGAYFEPFAASFANQFIINGSGTGGDLVTYELFVEYEKLIGMMFGMNVLFFWDTVNKRLDIQRNILAVESVALWVYISRPEEILLKDPYARPWLRDYSLAKCKDMMSDIRGKFSSMPGPGGIQLNGVQLKESAQAEMLRLDLELSTQVEGNQGYGFSLG